MQKAVRIDVGFEVFTAVTVKSAGFWDVALCVHHIAEDGIPQFISSLAVL
jgi:hypothetical protein